MNRNKIEQGSTVTWKDPWGNYRKGVVLVSSIRYRNELRILVQIIGQRTSSGKSICAIKFKEVLNIQETPDDLHSFAVTFGNVILDSIQSVSESKIDSLIGY